MRTWRSVGSFINVLGIDYRITEHLYASNYSLIYTAKPVTREGQYAQPTVLKEFCPVKSTRDSDGNVQLIGNADEKSVFEERRLSFLNEFRFGAQVAKETFQVIVEWQLDAEKMVAVIPKFSNDTFSLMQLLVAWDKKGYIDTDVRRLKRSLKILSSFLNVLAKIHKQGVLHLDVSPHNIVYGLENEMTYDGAAFIIDFGNARSARQKEGSPCVTDRHPTVSIGYAAPELYCDGAVVTAAADVYSTAVILFAMICGRRAFISDSDWEISNVYSLERLYRSDFSVVRRNIARLDIDEKLKNALLALLIKDLAPDPALRDQTAEDMNAKVGELIELVNKNTDLVTLRHDFFVRLGNKASEAAENIDAKLIPDYTFRGKTIGIKELVSLVAKPVDKLVLFSNIGGSGKTTSLRYIYRSLQENKDCICVYVPLANLLDDSSDLPVSSYILHELIGVDHSADDAIQMMKKLAESRSWVILLDGFDELPEMTNARTRVQRNIKQLMDADMAVILSTRTVPDEQKNWDLISVNGLSKRCIDGYLGRNEIDEKDPYLATPMMVRLAKAVLGNEQDTQIYDSPFEVKAEGKLTAVKLLYKYIEIQRTKLNILKTVNRFAWALGKIAWDKLYGCGFREDGDNIKIGIGIGVLKEYQNGTIIWTHRIWHDFFAAYYLGLMLMDTAAEISSLEDIKNVLEIRALQNENCALVSGVLNMISPETLSKTVEQLRGKRDMPYTVANVLRIVSSENDLPEDLHGLDLRRFNITKLLKPGMNFARSMFGWGTVFSFRRDIYQDGVYTEQFGFTAACYKYEDQCSVAIFDNDVLIEWTPILQLPRSIHIYKNEGTGAGYTLYLVYGIKRPESRFYQDSSASGSVSYIPMDDFGRITAEEKIINDLVYDVGGHQMKFYLNTYSRSISLPDEHDVYSEIREIDAEIDNQPARISLNNLFMPVDVDKIDENIFYEKLTWTGIDTDVEYFDDSFADTEGKVFVFSKCLRKIEEKYDKNWKKRKLYGRSCNIRIESRNGEPQLEDKLLSNIETVLCQLHGSSTLPEFIPFQSEPIVRICTTFFKITNGILLPCFEDDDAMVERFMTSTGIFTVDRYSTNYKYWAAYLRLNMKPDSDGIVGVDLKCDDGRLISFSLDARNFDLPTYNGVSSPDRIMHCIEYGGDHTLIYRFRADREDEPVLIDCIEGKVLRWDDEIIEVSRDEVSVDLYTMHLGRLKPYAKRYLKDDDPNMISFGSRADVTAIDSLLLKLCPDHKIGLYRGWERNFMSCANGEKKGLVDGLYLAGEKVLVFEPFNHFMGMRGVGAIETEGDNMLKNLLKLSNTCIFGPGEFEMMLSNGSPFILEEFEKTHRGVDAELLEYVLDTVAELRSLPE